MQQISSHYQQNENTGICISQVLKPIIREHNSGPWGNFASKNDQPLGKKGSKCPGCPGGGGGDGQC